MTRFVECVVLVVMPLSAWQRTWLESKVSLVGACMPKAFKGPHDNVLRGRLRPSHNTKLHKIRLR